MKTTDSLSPRAARAAVPRLLLAAITAAASGTAPAQDPDPTEEIIITANRVPIPRRQIATSVSVMDEREIEARGNFALSDLIRQMPAISSSSNGGIGNPTSVRIRGEEGYRTLTYMDGMRLQDPSIPQIATDYSQLLTDGVSRIEVLRGPQGLAYGADAGGVINISTRSVSEEFTASIDGQTGEFGSRQLAGNASGRSGMIDYSVSLSDFETDGFNTLKADDELMDEDGYENTTFHGRVGLSLGDRWRVDLVHRDVDSANEYDGCFDSVSFQTRYQCSNDYELSASRVGLEYGGEAFSHALSYTRTESRNQNYTAGVPTFGTLGEQERIEYIGSASALPGFDLVFGADQQEDEASGRSRKNNGLFLEYLSDFSDRLYFSAGLRHDDNEDFGSNSSYRVTAAYLMNPGAGTLKIKSALGSGFRAPSPYEIQYNNSDAAFPPASEATLLQEESEGWEAGIEFFAGNMRLEAVYFDQEVVNAIYFDLSGFSGYLQDTGTGNSRGVELTAELPLYEGLTFSGNYTYNDTERPDGTQRLRRPENLLNVGLLYSGFGSRLKVNGFYRSQSNTLDSGGPLQDFAVLDLTASYQLTENFRLYGRLENALDEDYEEVIGYNTPGTAAYIGMNFRFTGN